MVIGLLLTAYINSASLVTNKGTKVVFNVGDSWTQYVVELKCLAVFIYVYMYVYLCVLLELLPLCVCRLFWKKWCHFSSYIYI